jgi:hypothetical protein
VAFLTLATRSGNHQVWVTVMSTTQMSSTSRQKDFARRLRKGIGTDAAASGPTRVSGTVNYKRKYEPDFPIVSAVPGRIVTAEQLESLGLVAAPGPRAAPLRVSSSGSWPDYARCLQGAPFNHAQTGPDTSRADFLWYLMAAQRNHSVENIAAPLIERSTKAKETSRTEVDALWCLHRVD